MKPKRIEEESKRSLGNFESQPSYFFKLMLSPSSQSNKLRIPKKFARARRNELSSPAILTVPTGETRNVELIEEDNELWFSDGWKDFVEYFSIGFAYFLLFEHVGNSNFKVNIFDLTGFEISYPHNERINTSQLLHECCHVRHEGVDNDDDDNKEPEILHTPSINSKTSDVEVIQLSSEDEEEMDNATECTPLGYPLWLKKCQGLINVVTAAGIPLPENPFFVAAVKLYNLDSGMYLNIPMGFGRVYLVCEAMQRKQIILEAFDGRQWEVDCVRDRTKCNFRRGWITFARQIGLEVGDVCVYELTDVKKYVIKVHVVKKSEFKPSTFF